MKKTFFITILSVLSFTQMIDIASAQALADISGEEVVSTANQGNNEVEIITLTPQWWDCRQSSTPDDCIRKNQGTFKTTYLVNCATKSIDIKNRFGSRVENIVPGEIANYNFRVHGIYDYACGTNYSQGWASITIKKR